MDTNQNYTKCSRGFYSLFRSGHIWREKDHLLVVVNNMNTQNYRRLYFRDIEGVVITESARHVFIIVLAVLTLVLLGFSLRSGFSVPVVVAMGFVTAMVTVYVALGKVGQVSIQTKLGVYRLPFSVRVPLFEKIMKNIIPDINEAQREFDSKQTSVKESESEQIMSVENSNNTTENGTDL